MSTEHKDEPRSVTGLFVALGVVALLVLGAAYWWHWQGQVRAAHVNVTATELRPGQSPFVRPSTPSDEQLAAMAVRDQLTRGAATPKSGSTLSLCRLESGFAAVSYVPTGGAVSTYVVKHIGSGWQVIWSGPNVTAAVATANGLPTDYTKVCAASTLLYTF